MNPSDLPSAPLTGPGTAPATAPVSAPVSVRTTAPAPAQDEATLVRRLTCFDSLTALPNRLLFREQLGLALRLAQREHRPVAVLLADIDAFRRIKNAVGHRASDDVIRSVAARIASALRGADIVARDVLSAGQPSALARLSSNEFAIVLTRLAEPSDARLVARRLQRAVAADLLVGHTVVHPSLSIGVALFPDDGNQADALLECAEAALLSAKDGGGERIQFFDTALDANASDQLALENDLRIALRRGEIVPHFQPRVDARSGQMVGAEALARWQHPTRGAVPPLAFIPAAERCGLIGVLGEAMLDAVCQQAQAWQRAGLPAIPFGVNVSAEQFAHTGFASTVAQVLERSHLPPHCLELEITESLLMKDAQRALHTFAAIRQTGVRIAIDDFGTGYSSFAYLRDFEFDVLKIDRSFVHGLPDDRRLAALTSSLIDLSRRLDLEVVAEGVEQEAEQNFLLRNGCMHMQGYRFCRPAPAAQFEAWWRQRLGAPPADAAG